MRTETVKLILALMIGGIAVGNAVTEGKARRLIVLYWVLVSAYWAVTMAGAAV